MNQDLTYEQALEKLDEQLKLIEDGNLSLDDALKAVDSARVYLKVCMERLEDARKRIEVRAEPEATEKRPPHLAALTPASRPSRAIAG